MRAAARYPARRLAWFAVDRASRLSARLAPAPLLDTLLRPSDLRTDGELLRRWGSRPGLANLGPRWEPARHGDPRTGVFRILGTERRDPSFADPGVDPLWDERLAGLHSTWALAGTCQGPRVRAWLAEWLPVVQTATRPGTRALHPYPTATRILHGARTLALLNAAGHGEGPAADALTLLIWRDGAWLRWRVEHHNAANHLLREQIALLVWARVFGRADLASRRRADLRATLAAQFGPCGGHVEQAAPYHARCVRDLLDLAGLLDAAQEPLPRELIGAAVDFLGWLAVDDGVVLLGDGDGIGDPPPQALFAAAEALGIPRTHRDTLHSPTFGLAGRRSGASTLLLRAGAVPAVTCAHVHADQGAIAWVRAGQRLVDGRGTATYWGPGRDATRANANASTVAVPGRSTARFAGPFRLAAHGRGELLSGPALSMRSHGCDGGPLFERSVTLDDDIVTVTDVASGAGVARFHLPDAELVSVGAHEVVAARPGGRLLLTSDGPLRAARSTWYPRIGVGRPALTVTVRLVARSAKNSGIPARSQACTTIRFVPEPGPPE